MTTSRDAIDAALGHFAVAFAYLFGSRVGATADPRSDWDVAVYLSRLPEEAPIWERFRIEDALARALGSDDHSESLGRAAKVVGPTQVDRLKALAFSLQPSA